jgi:hypothetical protein
MLVEKEAVTLRAEKQALAQGMAGFEIKITELEIQLDGVRKELECTKLSLDNAVAQSLVCHYQYSYTSYYTCELCMD